MHALIVQEGEAHHTVLVIQYLCITSCLLNFTQHFLVAHTAISPA